MDSQLFFLPAPTTPTTPELSVVGVVGVGCFFVITISRSDLL